MRARDRVDQLEAEQRAAPDNLLTEWGQSGAGRLEVSDPQRYADDRQAQQAARDQVAKREPPSGENEPEDLPDGAYAAMPRFARGEPDLSMGRPTSGRELTRERFRLEGFPTTPYPPPLATGSTRPSPCYLSKLGGRRSFGP